MAVRLNGWQRLWLVLSLVWTVFVAQQLLTPERSWLFGYNVAASHTCPNDLEASDTFGVTLCLDRDGFPVGGAIPKLHVAWDWFFVAFPIVALLPPAMIYVLGLVVRWIVKGFRAN